MLLPGPEAMQLATYAGWRLRGVPGALIAGGLFVLPGALVVAGLAAIYAYFGQVPLIASVFLGVKATVVVIVIDALLRVSKRALSGGDQRAIALLSFLAIFALQVPYPLIVLAAALWGAVRCRPDIVQDPGPPRARSGTLATLVIWLTLWFAPLAALWLADAQLLTQIGMFFSRLAVVTFGGAYAVLAYMTQEVVEGYGWITTAQMMDGLGLAETTPGPLILVTEFVGFLAGFREGGIGLALAAAAVTLWVTFIPCFLWIFAGAPYIDRMSSRPRLVGALAGITAAVVGVILNLSLWFAAHVFFASVGRAGLGPVDIVAPDPATFDPAALALATGAAVLILRLRWSLPRVLGLAALAGLGLGLLP